MKNKTNIKSQDDINSTAIKRESFYEWQNKISEKIIDVLAGKVEDNFKITHRKNIVLSDNIHEEDKKYEKKEDIENNFLYNIPNISIFLYQTFGEESKELILSLLKLYQTITGLKFLGINFLNKEDFPKKFINYTNNKELNDKYILYLIGKVRAVKYFDKKESKLSKPELLEKYKLKIKDLFEKSGLFRKGLENQLNTITKVRELEYIRKLVYKSFQNMKKIKTVSDREWIEYLGIEAKEDLKELKKKLKELESNLLDEIEENKKRNIEIEIEDIKEDIKINKKNIAIGKGEKIESFSINTSNLLDELELEKFKKDREDRIALGDHITLNFLENKILEQIMYIVSRYQKNTSDNNKLDSIPKNFLENRNFTCFSGTWLITSILLSAGFKENDIYTVNSFVGVSFNRYKHSYVLLRTSNGGIVKLDYGFNDLENVWSKKDNLLEDRYIKLLNLGYNSSGFFQNKNMSIEGLDRVGRIYRAVDGISLMYLINQAYIKIDDKDYDGALELLDIANPIDKDNTDLLEAYGLIYDKLGDTKKAKTYFKKIKYMSIGAFMTGKYAFIDGDYKLAKEKLEDFNSSLANSRKIDDRIKLEASRMLDIIKEKNIDISCEEKKLKGKDYCIKFIADRINIYTKNIQVDDKDKNILELEKIKDEYSILEKGDRKMILEVLTIYLVCGYKGATDIFLFLNYLIYIESNLDKDLYKQIKIKDFNLTIK